MAGAGWFVLLFALPSPAGDDAYGRYVRTAPEFRRVPAVRGRWKSWIYMPWRYRWEIGTGDAGGEFCSDFGIRGGFTDHGAGPIEWLEKWKLHFYNDHTAGKGILYLRGANDKDNFTRFQTDPKSVRTVPLDAVALAEAKKRVRANLARVKKSAFRVAYALDDEISTGAFVVPIPWRVNGDEAAYGAWLEEIYGEPRFVRWVTPEYTRRQLAKPLAEIDLSPLLDRMSYQDTVLARFVGALVRTANEEDPETPCGIVGAQNPSLWGGYDYAKLARQVQFIEAYDIGSAPEICRSFGRANGAIVVSTHFSDDRPERNAWQAWRHFAHGQRGMIGWVEKWFEKKEPRPWLKAFAPVMRELSDVCGPKMEGARWLHDGIALYYSHPSHQVSWCLDAEPHGATWPRRGRDHVLGTAHNVRKAWEYLLTDAGLQYDFIDYAAVIRDGVPEEYRVVVLPACFALSDAEAKRLREFVARGGRVVADFMCGIFDEHGKGRKRGALDGLFGVAHDGSETAADFFGKELWVETNQERAFGFRLYRDLLKTHRGRVRAGYSVAENRLEVPARGRGAVYLNLSPQRYLEMREAGTAGPAAREPFVGALGIAPWVRAEGDGLFEVTYWTRGDRILLFAVQNPLRYGDGEFDIQGGRTRVTLRFVHPVRDVIDERTGEALGDGRTFRLQLDRAEAVFVSLRR